MGKQNMSIKFLNSNCNAQPIIIEIISQTSCTKFTYNKMEYHKEQPSFKVGDQVWL